MEIVIQSLYSFHFLSDEPPFVAWAGIINTKKPAKFTTLF